MLFVKSTALLLLGLLATLCGRAEGKAMFGIGMRIIGDQLIVKDVLQARPAGVDQSPTILFNYAVPEPITYIEIRSDENVYAEVNFSYYHNLVKGTVEAINTTTTEAFEPFEVLITIYGFNETMLNVNPSLILNRDRQYDGILEPMHDEEDDDDDLEALEHENEDDDNGERYLNLSEDDETSPKSLDDEVADDDNDDNDDYDDDDADFEHKDHIIELGHRQKGDYLIYETYHMSDTSTAELTNHSVVFYYIDSNFITCVQFVILDHFVDKSPTEEHDTAVGEYSHWSPNSLKAVITDFKTLSLFVKMYMYGYRPADLPAHYEFYLPNHIATELPRLMAADDGGEALLQHANAAVVLQESADASEGNAAAQGRVASMLWVAMPAFLFSLHSRI